MSRLAGFQQQHPDIDIRISAGDVRAEEPFGPPGRLAAPNPYWLLPLPDTRLTPELRAFLAWVRGEAAITRAALGDTAAP